MTYLIHSQIRIKIDTPPRIKKIVQDISILFFTTFVISFELVRYPCTWIYKIEIEETVYGGGLFEETMYRGGQIKDLLWPPLFSFGNGSSDSERPLDRDLVGREQFWTKIIHQNIFQNTFDQDLFWKMYFIFISKRNYF